MGCWAVWKQSEAVLDSGCGRTQMYGEESFECRMQSGTFLMLQTPLQNTDPSVPGSLTNLSLQQPHKWPQQLKTVWNPGSGTIVHWPTLLYYLFVVAVVTVAWLGGWVFYDRKYFTIQGRKKWLIYYRTCITCNEINNLFSKYIYCVLKIKISSPSTKEISIVKLICYVGSKRFS